MGLQTAIFNYVIVKILIENDFIEDIFYKKILFNFIFKFYNVKISI